MARFRALQLCLLTLLITGAALALFYRGEEHLARWELRGADLLAQQGRKTPPNPKIIFLAIDTESVSIDAETDLKGLFGLDDPSSIEGQALGKMSGSWPWPRSVYPLILDRLFGAGAAVVTFDLTFTSPTAADPAFRASLEKYRDRVVLGSYFVDSPRLGVGNADVVHTRPTETLIPGGAALDDRVGYVNFWTDADEVVRDGLFHASLLTLRDRSGPGDALFSSLAAQAVRKMGRADLIPNDAESHTLRLSDWPGRGFPPRSIFEIFVPEYWQRNYRGGEVFRDAIVVIGAAGNWQHDEHRTALGVMPGPELQCNAINALLHRGFIQRASLLVCLGCILGAGLLALALSWLTASPGIRVAGALAAVAGFLGLALLLYNRADYLLPLVTPLAVFIANALGGLFCDFLAVRRERRRVRTTLERYVSKNIVGELLERSEGDLHALGGRVRPVTILFSDIRSFTRVCAHTDPQELVQLLNEYLTVMVECAFRHRGTLDKFIGDAIMVVWGNVSSQGAAADARQALHCALEMQEELAKLNRRWAAEGREPIRIGIALNHGEVVAGNIGSPHRMEFTVIGNAVNVCWRLQERTKEHPGGLILGESMAPLIGDEYPLEPLGNIIVGEALEVEYYGLGTGEESATKAEEAMAAG